MPCQECMALLTDHLEGTLTPEKRSALEAHLKVCPDCGPHNANFLKAIELVRAAGRAPAPSGPSGPSPAADGVIRSILKTRRGGRA